MTELKVLRFPDRDLRKKALKVQTVSDAERRIIADMTAIMYLNKGVGLAAVQVGVPKQITIIDVGDGLVKLINPVIVKKEGAETEEEGCLSLPDVHVRVKRAKSIVVTFLNEEGSPNTVRAEGLFSRAIQHELDHLSGRLIIDYLNPIKKAFVYINFAKDARFRAKKS